MEKLFENERSIYSAGIRHGLFGLSERYIRQFSVRDDAIMEVDLASRCSLLVADFIFACF